MAFSLLKEKNSFQNKDVCFFQNETSPYKYKVDIKLRCNLILDSQSRKEKWLVHSQMLAIHFNDFIIVHPLQNNKCIWNIYALE